MRKGHQKMLVLTLAVVVLGGLLVAPIAAAADAPAWVAGTINGKGYNFNLPLANAEVELWWVESAAPTFVAQNTGFSAITAPNGQYVINAMTQDTNPSLPLYYYAGNYIIVPHATYYRTSTDLSTYQPAFSVTAWNYTLSDATFKTMTVLETVYRGKVVNKRTNKALKGVKVTVAGNKNYAFKTNSNGKYTTYKLTTEKQTLCLLKPDTKYKVKFTKSGYKPRTLTLWSSPEAYDAGIPGTWVDVNTVKMTKK